MVNVREAIYQALTAAAGSSAGVYHFYPDKNATYPAISFYENGNRRAEQADGCEHLTEVTYQVDIWAKSIVTCDGLAASVDEKLTALGFAREQANDIYDMNCQHKTMRYRGLIDQDGTVYQ